MQKQLEKFNNAIKNTNFLKLHTNERNFIKDIALRYRLSFQEIKIVINIANDIIIWDEGSIINYINGSNKEIKDYKLSKKLLLKDLKRRYEDLKYKPNSYKDFILKTTYRSKVVKTKTIKQESLGLGNCPVASEKTRCCNLLTLDAVESCGFDCSYCSIQSFYNQNQVIFDKNFKNKLKNIKLDPNKRYHIGTGQSSDSLMWGNKEGILEALFEFASLHKNVILELKTKSNNIKYLLKNEVPKNIIVTWSLNTPTIINNEEHLSAKLDERINSAKKLANKGIKVGFHFHPIVHYENYLEEYKQIFKRLQDEISYDKIVMISFGTLTYIKSVLKQIRERNFKSKIYQMPLIEVEGKYSYPENIKIEMFKTAYESFKHWHDKVFFYLCMEPHLYWKKCFGYEYKDNNEFEEDMLKNYFSKVAR
jgi:spore photoproduct lyase